MAARGWQFSHSLGLEVIIFRIKFWYSNCVKTKCIFASMLIQLALLNTKRHKYALLDVPASFLSSYSLSNVEFCILYLILANMAARGDQFSHPLGLEVM